MESEKHRKRLHRREPDNAPRAVPDVTAERGVDPLIRTAARALASGDPLTALNWVALRRDAAALALRGIAMAQLGDLVLGKALLKRAARAFGSKDALARARCIIAETEIALVSRDLTWPSKALQRSKALRLCWRHPRHA
jgi:hypothetical protein